VPPRTRERVFLRQPALPPGFYQDQGNGKAETTITDEQRATLTALLAKKGRTPGASLKTAGCHSADLAGLSLSQYRLLVEKLFKLPDHNGVKKGVANEGGQAL
jgi:hypothetical protein